jgi:hypothetical protein
MSLAGRIIRFSLAAVLSFPLLGGVAPARAQPGPPAVAGSTERAALTAERARVRAQLDRVNNEIDTLKRTAAASPLGMRDDYKLRARLADAEALARRLTEIDARLGAPVKPAPGEPGLAVVPPTLALTDGPGEMEAKADILADQARRAAVEADTLSRRAGQLKARRDLRRRAGQLEHDPFSPLEGARSRSIAVGPSVATPSGATGFDGARAAQPPAVNTGSGQGAGSVAVNGTVGPGGATSSPASQTAGGSAHGLVTPSTPPAPTAGATGSDAPALSVQLRDVLDPATLADIRRLEASGSPSSTIEALERAAAGLRARADRLKGQSQDLRARAHAR